MANLLGFENEYDILNTKSKVCIIKNAWRLTNQRWIRIQTSHKLLLCEFTNLYFILDSRRNRKMVYQGRHARSKKTSTFNEKGLRGLENIGKW